MDGAWRSLGRFSELVIRCANRLQYSYYDLIQSCKRGWEHIEQRPHGTPDMLAGQTDGAALRRYGVPTARIGWPWPATGAPLPVAEGLGGMGATYIPDLMPCAEKILYALIDTLTRPREELGL